METTAVAAAAVVVGDVGSEGLLLESLPNDWEGRGGMLRLRRQRERFSTREGIA